MGLSRDSIGGGINLIIFLSLGVFLLVWLFFMGMYICDTKMVLGLGRYVCIYRVMFLVLVMGRLLFWGSMLRVLFET